MALSIGPLVGNLICSVGGGGGGAGGPWTLLTCFGFAEPRLGRKAHLGMNSRTLASRLLGGVGPPGVFAGASRLLVGIGPLGLLVGIWLLVGVAPGLPAGASRLLVGVGPLGLLVGVGAWLLVGALENLAPAALLCLSLPLPPVSKWIHFGARGSAVALASLLVDVRR
jgi:hypothetical protein